MNTPTPVLRLPRTGVAFLFTSLLLLTAPSVAAQLPIGDPAEETLRLALATDGGFVQVNYPSNGQTRISVHDLSEDSGWTPSSGRTTVKPHNIEITLANAAEIAEAGWLVNFGPTFIQSFGGDINTVEVEFVAQPQITEQSITAQFVAQLIDQNTGRSTNGSINLTGEVNRYSRPFARIPSSQISQEAGQFKVVTYDILVRNEGVYPDHFRIDVRLDKEGFYALYPPSLYLEPQTERTVTIQVQTPKGKLYEFGNSATLAVSVESTFTGASFPVTGILRVEGFYISTYWIPLLLVGLVSASVITRDASQRRELRRLEKGKPRRIEPTPRQAVMLAELARTDRDEYKAYRAKMAALYKARREKYGDERKQVVARDRDEKRQARAEYNAAKKRQKGERKVQAQMEKTARAEQKRQAKIERKAAKAQRKIDKKQAKVDAKERKKLNKELEKKRKLLAKARGKADKVAAKEAKAEAKRAKAEEKAAKKAAKKGKSPDNKP